MGEAARRARKDIEEGRLWKARDRLTGALRTSPTDQEVLGLLGDVYHSMGDLPRAGAAWALTTRDDAKAQEAFDATRERYGNDPRRILEALPLSGPFADFPPGVAERLRTLAARSTVDGQPAAVAKRLLQQADAPKTHSGRGGLACCFALLVVAPLFATALIWGLVNTLEAAGFISVKRRDDLSWVLASLAVVVVALPLAGFLVTITLQSMKTHLRRFRGDPLLGPDKDPAGRLDGDSSGGRR